MLKVELPGLRYCTSKCPFRVRLYGYNGDRYLCVLFNKRLKLLKGYGYLTVPIC